MIKTSKNLRNSIKTPRDNSDIVAERLKTAKQEANNRGGDLISTSIEKFSDKLKWKCKYGHEWEATYSNVIDNKTWCPKCKIPISENICREYLEFLLGENFNKIRPKWLLSNKNRPMELDGYCEKLGIAFEHNGVCHYKDVFANTIDPLKERIDRDQLKIDLCSKK